jgi:hypothetical protein
VIRCSLYGAVAFLVAVTASRSGIAPSSAATAWIIHSSREFTDADPSRWWLASPCADMCGSAELAESVPMLVRLETEHRHEGCAHHDTQCNRSDGPQGETSNAKEADRDDPEPRRVACE